MSAAAPSAWCGRATGSPRPCLGRPEVRYGYDPAGRLVAATGRLGTRTYRWDEADLVTAVIDADGVVEAENAYDSGAPGREPTLALRPSDPLLLPARSCHRGRPTRTAERLQHLDRRRAWPSRRRRRCARAAPVDELRPIRQLRARHRPGRRGHGSGVRRARAPGPPGHPIRRGRALDLRRRRPGRDCDNGTRRDHDLRVRRRRAQPGRRRRPRGRPDPDDVAERPADPGGRPERRRRDV